MTLLIVFPILAIGYSYGANEGLLEALGEAELEGLREADGLCEAEGLDEALGETEREAEALGLIDALGLSEALGLTERLALELGERDADGETDGDGDGEALPIGKVEVTVAPGVSGFHRATKRIRPAVIVAVPIVRRMFSLVTRSVKLEVAAAAAGEAFHQPSPAAIAVAVVVVAIPVVSDVVPIANVPPPAETGVTSPIAMIFIPTVPDTVKSVRVPVAPLLPPPSKVRRRFSAIPVPAIISYCWPRDASKFGIVFPF